MKNEDNYNLYLVNSVKKLVHEYKELGYDTDRILSDLREFDDSIRSMCLVAATEVDDEELLNKVNDAINKISEENVRKLSMNK